MPSVSRLLGAALVSSPRAEDGMIVGNARVAAVAAAPFNRSRRENEAGLREDMAGLLAVGLNEAERET